MQAAGSLVLAGAVVAPAAGLMEMEVTTPLGVVLVCPTCVVRRLQWVLGEITAPVEKKFSQSAVHGKSKQAADPLRDEFVLLFLAMSIRAGCSALS